MENVTAFYNEFKIFATDTMKISKWHTLQDIFIWIIILGIGIVVVRKYGDFFQKSPNFVPQIKLSCFHAKLFQRNQNQFLMEFLKIVKN